ncbi:MAG: S26 family signal peptidase, partial [Longimicrobiales bacterium]
MSEETEETPGSGEEASAEPSLAKQAWDQVWPLAVAVLIALGIRAVVIESYYVPSGSMFPTLLIGDHVFVNKFTYGARLPFTDTKLPDLGDPKRG